MSTFTERNLSPGLAYLIDTILPRYGGPLLAIWAGYQSLERLGYSDKVPPSLATPSGLFLVSIGYHLGRSICGSLWDGYIRRQEMRALNATLAVRAGDGWLPGNLDTLYSIVTTTEKEYLGYPMVEWKQVVGNLFSLTVLGDYSVRIYFVR